MDLELREALALSDDRSAAISRLLPGSEDHDFYRCLRAQHLGALDDADAILRAWPERHGNTQRYQQLRLRQLLYRAQPAITADGNTADFADAAGATDELRDWLGVSHWHEAEVEEVDPTRAARLPAG